MFDVRLYNIVGAAKLCQSQSAFVKIYYFEIKNPPKNTGDRCLQFIVVCFSIAN